MSTPTRAPEPTAALVRVYGVRPHHAGFGEYDLTADCAEHPGTLDDYLDYVRTDVGLRQLTDDELDDLDVDGRIHNQRGTLIGWEMEDGTRFAECVVEIEG